MGEFSLLHLGLGLIPLLLIIPVFVAAVLYCNTLYQLMQTLDPANRPFPAGLVWLTLIPVLGLAWLIAVVILLSNSLKLQLQAHGGNDDGARTLSIAFGASIALCIVPFINVLASLATFALWILHWLKMLEYRKQLAPSR